MKNLFRLLIIIVIVLLCQQFNADAQTKINLGNTIVWPKDSSIISKSSGLYLSTPTTWKPVKFTWVGMTDWIRPAMTVGTIDSTQKTWVNIDPKQIHWVNDSTFYIQHKKY